MLGALEHDDERRGLRAIGGKENAYWGAKEGAEEEEEEDMLDGGIEPEEEYVATERVEPPLVRRKSKRLLRKEQKEGEEKEEEEEEAREETFKRKRAMFYGGLGEPPAPPASSVEPAVVVRRAQSDVRGWRAPGEQRTKRTKEVKRRRGGLRLYAHQEEGVGRIMRGWLRDLYESKQSVQARIGGAYEEAAYEVKRTRAFLLCDEMGLGKTIQSLEAIKRLKARGLLQGPALVLSPPACLRVWAAELEKFYGDEFKVFTLMGQDVTSANVRAFDNNTVVLCTYNTMQTSFLSYVNECFEELTGAEYRLLLQVMGRSVAWLAGRDLESSATKNQLRTHARTQLELLGSSRIKNEARKAAAKLLMRRRWGVLVMDEIQKIKSQASKCTKAAAWVQANYRLGLSGTPIMNSGKEMITLLKLGLQLFDADWFQVGRMPDGKYSRTLINTVTMGRQKKDVPQLRAMMPARDKEKEKIRVPWTDPGAIRTYRTVKDSAVRAHLGVEQLRRRPDESQRDYDLRRLSATNSFWTQVARLRQICLHPDLPLYMADADFSPQKEWGRWTPRSHAAFPEHYRTRVVILLMCLRRACPAMGRDVRNTLCEWLGVAEERMIQPSPKMSYFLRMYYAAPPSSKIVVVSQFRQFFERIMAPWLTQMGVRYALFVGGSRKRQSEALASFEHDPEVRVLLLSKSAGSLGLNLQHASDTVVLMEPHFNESLDEQAAQRVDRIGQVGNVTVRKLFMKGSIDEAMRVMQEKKTVATDAWLGRNSKQRSLKDVSMFLSEFDTVGKGEAPPIPDAQKTLPDHKEEDEGVAVAPRPNLNATFEALASMVAHKASSAMSALGMFQEAEDEEDDALQEGLECAICFEVLDTHTVSTLACSHSFCKECVHSLLERDAKCALCGAPFESLPEASPAMMRKVEEFQRVKAQRACWSCPTCSFVNPQHAKSCEMCALRVDKPKDVPCVVCTFLNAENAQVCAMCGVDVAGAPPRREEKQPGDPGAGSHSPSYSTPQTPPRVQSPGYQLSPVQSPGYQLSPPYSSCVPPRTPPRLQSPGYRPSPSYLDSRPQTPEYVSLRPLVPPSPSSLSPQPAQQEDDSKAMSRAKATMRPLTDFFPQLKVASPEARSMPDQVDDFGGMRNFASSEKRLKPKRRKKTRRREALPPPPAATAVPAAPSSSVLDLTNIDEQELAASDPFICPTCTFLNEEALKNCAVCGAVRPTRQLPMDVIKSAWE